MSITRLLHSSMKPVLPVSIVIGPSPRIRLAARHSGDPPRPASMAESDPHAAPPTAEADYTHQRLHHEAAACSSRPARLTSSSSTSPPTSLDAVAVAGCD